MTYEFDWEWGAEGARLLRVYGMTAEAVLPGEIEGIPVTEIGAYCFAERAHLPEHYETTRAKTAISGQLRELSGGYIEKVVLPDSVKRIGNLAFYNCTALRLLEFGSELAEIGSDAFMNCKNLHHMTVHCGSGERSGIRQILAQISADMEVTFRGREEIEAVLLFPEYYESYDEIAPAHLFGRNIEGEGFRARQCFKEGIPDFMQYDTIFPKACAEESEKTLCRLAMNRLRYPVNLGAEAGRRYEDYIRAHAGAVCAAAARERDMQPVLFLCERGLGVRSNLEEGMHLSADLDWAEGAAWFLRLLEQFFPKKSAENRYGFEDF